MTTYIQAIGWGFPNVQCHCIGDGSVYENIVHDSGDPLPSKATLDDWIANNNQPVTNQTLQFLADGTPAYYYSPADTNISIDKATITFSTRTNGAKNFYLDLQNADSSTNGFPVRRKAIIKNLSVSLRTVALEAVFVSIRDSLGVTLASVLVPAGVKTATATLAVTIASGTSLSCFLSCSKNVANPIVICELAWRD